MPSTYIDSGTVASEMSGASVAPTIEPVAKITAELAPVSAWAAASRTTLDLTRASLASSSVAVTSIIGTSARTATSALLLASTMKGRGGAINRHKRARAMRRHHLCCRSLEGQHQIVGGHFRHFAQHESGALAELLEIGDIAHAPFGIAFAKAGVEHGVRERGVLAVALERAVQEQLTVAAQIISGARKQALRDAPWRDVDDVGAEHRQQFCRRAGALHCRNPLRVGEIDPQRRADVRQTCMRPPGGNAFQVRIVEIARPPDDVGAVTGKMHHVLAGAAAGFQHVAALACEEFLQDRP